MEEKIWPDEDELLRKQLRRDAEREDALRPERLREPQLAEEPDAAHHAANGFKAPSAVRG